MKSWEHRAKLSLKKEIEKKAMELTRFLALYSDAAHEVDSQIWRELVAQVPAVEANQTNSDNE